MSEPSVDDLRQQLRERGYLSHGVERWFAHDPWSSRTFWIELLTLSAKAATLIALFALLPLTTVMVLRNHPLSAGETSIIGLLYGAAAWIVAFALLLAMALLLRVRPGIAVDTPHTLLAVSLLAATVLIVPLAVWWLGFDTPAALFEVLLGLTLITLLFLASTTVISAALLSFSIYELKRIPAIHQTSRTAPMSVAALILIALLFVPAYASQDRSSLQPPSQVVTSPGSARVAFIAVDGLTLGLLQAHPSLTSRFASVTPGPRLFGGSAPERLAFTGTGVINTVHGVHSVEGVRILAGPHVLQSVSRVDRVLRVLGEMIGLTRREPLPPTVRRRDYVWELFAHRGVPSVAVNWWTSDDARMGGLESVGQATVFARASAEGGPPEQLAQRVDAEAGRLFLEAIDRTRPRFATVYLPSLDIVINRLTLDPHARVALSAQAVGRLENLFGESIRRGYDVVLLGLPGEGFSDSGVLAWTLRAPCCEHVRAEDLAPTLCALMGFPASNEMVGRSLIPETLPRISTYGPRQTAPNPVAVDQEYYRSLRSLGYVR